MVWDRVIPVGRPAVEGWGGLGYAIVAASVSAAPGWTVRPLARVGRDRARDVERFFAEVESDLGGTPIDTSGLVVVDEPNNAVELRYHDSAERVETLTGGVGPWTEHDVLAAVDGVDALLVNFISGFELTHDVLSAVRGAVSGPMYGDLHSLFLGIDADGRRFPRPLPNPGRWMACFDVVQMNEAEATLVEEALPAVARDEAPTSALSLAHSAGCAAAVVTLGGAGVRWSHGAGRGRLPGGRSDGARRVDGSVTIRALADGDPTGCGDVWGGACFARLVAGDPLDVAAEYATRVATINVGTNTAEGLTTRLVNEGER
ncbi:MAG: carbohydrate kinase family protein [Gemmatimonadota bacterium]